MHFASIIYSVAFLECMRHSSRFSFPLRFGFDYCSAGKNQLATINMRN